MSAISQQPSWRVTSLNKCSSHHWCRKKKGAMILYLRKFSKQSLSVIQGTASFSPVCYHKVILQDATAVSLSRTHIMVLMKTITLYNILRTFTLIQNFIKIQLLFK